MGPLLPEKTQQSSAKILAESRYSKRIKDEYQLQLHHNIERRNIAAALISKWQDNADHVAWKSNLKRLTAQAFKDTAQTNKEALLLRRKELRLLFEKDQER
ncbi:hypothetical protein BASA83_005317 [Batrachochytrium salamandrivorans]|nr:hypothetical protein BASA62_007947 [Batrachochytrium salamandrivorans]KAH9272508.1 hypothetical protein BASA83_005317 [Batrachochytrium salamandrivorans]